jgi:hypothetical protein
VPFPLSYSGRLVLNRPGQAIGVDALRRALVLRGAKEVERRERSTWFRVGWLVSNGPLWFIDRGEVSDVMDEDDRQLTYTLSFRRSAALAAVGTYGWIAGFGMRGESLLLRATVGSVGFLWIFGLWYLIVPWRFARFLTRVADGGER